MKSLVAIVFIAFAAVVFTNPAVSSSLLDVFKPTVAISVTVWNEDQMEKEDIYHESDDLLVDSDEYIIYLNQTSPVCDTVYIIHYLPLH